MIIHVVKPGDTLYEIGQLYNVDYREIASYNQIPINQLLVVGQTLVIITNNNNQMSKIEVNGYAFPNIDREILKDVISSLTYLSIFSYRIDEKGNLSNLKDDELIAILQDYGIVPIMVVTNIGTEGRFDSDLVSYVLNNEELQNRLITNILYTMNSKGYGGINIDFEYVYPADEDVFIKFLSKLRESLQQYNYYLSVSVAPKTSDEQKGVLYEAHNYERIGKLVDRLVIMTYEWGYSGGPARAVAPVNLVERVINYAVTKIEPSKILMGIPNYGYDWTLPYVEGALAKSVSNYEAVDIARQYYEPINYDNVSKAPYFNYTDSNMIEHEVWFEDARSIQAKLNLVTKYNLAGVSYWTINRFFPQNYLVLNSMFSIKNYNNNLKRVIFR